MEERFYFCESCGNLLITALSSGIIPYCCNERMTLLEPNTSDGNGEKHLPVVRLLSDHTMRVTVGEQPHPMTATHNIRFICVITSTGGVVRYLNEGDAPEACIRYDGKPKSVYAYCNQHGLWRVDL